MTADLHTRIRAVLDADGTHTAKSLTFAIERELAQPDDRPSTVKAEHDRLREGIERLADTIHGDDGWEHNDGCVGEPDCFACIELDLRVLLEADR